MKLFNRYPVLKAVIVHTTTDRSFRGLLWERRGGFLVLRNAELLAGDGSTPLDGDTLIPDDVVDFVQVTG